MREHVPLAPLTTFGIGGTARFFIEVQSVEEITEALAFARANSLPFFVLGGGSNIVIADSGFDGLVLAICIAGIMTENKDDGKILVTTGAGVVWDDFVLWTINHGLAGLECMSGIPGTVGGALVANLGAYGAQCSDTFMNAEVIDARDKSGKVHVINKEECNFSYHDSMFGSAHGRYIIARATFLLSADSVVTPSYKDNRFDMTTLITKSNRGPTIADIRNAVLDVREQKGSLIMKDRMSYKCAGSFFHMPFVSSEEYAEIVKRAQELDAKKEEILRPWAWEQSNGTYKIAPGFLLEYTEFKKGYIRGEVGVSPRHTLTIINIKNANAQDIARLAADMQNAVEKIFKLRLEREVEYVGEVETFSR